MMELGYKEQLSTHVEKIFKNYVTPGLHICDIATGGGKSYTIGKLTCEYYPLHFDRIIILCVQNKLVNGMDREIEKFISTPESKIKPKDKLVIENNSEVIMKAIKNSCFSSLLEEMELQIDDQKRKDTKVTDLKYSFNWVKKTFEGLSGLVKTYESNNNEYIRQQIDESEANLRKAVRVFFENFKKHLESTKQFKHVSVARLNLLFPHLRKVYPQVDYKNKKVLLMTVHKSMYGIDPIIDEKFSISDFSKKGKKTLILFDESDQAAIAMRNAIIDQAIDGSYGNKRFAKGYNGFLQYKSLLESPEHMSNSYYGTGLEDCVRKAREIINTNWEKAFGETKPYNSIFLDTPEEIEEFRRGVFFSGPIKLSISQSGEKKNSFVCYRKGNRHLSLVHSNDKDSLNADYSIVIPLDEFLTLTTRNITSVKSQFRNVIKKALEDSRNKFDDEIRQLNNTGEKTFLGYPTLEREIHTFFSRFESASEFHFEQQQTEFMTNRKNHIITKDANPIKLPDYSVYSQGVQFFQEEIDERDNQHRVRLSSREITNTPEKILLNLTHFDDNAVVLCSATASNKSVVSNFDLVYLKEILGDKVHTLSKEDRIKFDDLVAATYPQKHRIEAIPIEHYEYKDKRENHLVLPQKYKDLFSAKAQEEGLDEEWFLITVRNLRIYDKEMKSTFFHLYRLFQFIEAYHWFITHDDIRSMIFFQNRTGKNDRDQIITLSCLIDGTYGEMPSKLDGEIPTDWENSHIRITKELEEVENNILVELSQNKDAKIMLVSAYGSFKAGTNMQYEIPEGLDYISGDNWIEDGKKLKKDWDALYLQSPTNYLMMSEDGYESTFEKSFYNAMLVLMMLYERGCLSKYDVARWLYQALTNTFYFSEKRDPGIANDKAAWAQTIVEQAVGRLCRTRNKPHTTYLLYDESMTPYFDSSIYQKSLTKEYRVLVNHILEHPTNNEITASTVETILCHTANHAQYLLDNMRRQALYFTPHKEDFEDDFDDEDSNEDIPYNILASQRMNQSYKRAIIKKPVISGWDDLDEEDRYLTFITKCYGGWQRDDKGGFYFSYDNYKICPDGNGTRYYISPSDVRLDVLMKNKVIRNHFEKNGFATDWKGEGLILHPQILRTDYAGEIGEEAFKALLIHYTDCKEEEIKHLEGKDYELADYVICHPDGSYRIAFDVKNMNPKADHNDKYGDIPTSEKRQRKTARLNCRLITVNILQIDDSLMDEINEIGGLIDENGVIVHKGIETLRKLVNVQ